MSNSCIMKSMRSNAKTIAATKRTVEAGRGIAMVDGRTFTTKG